MKKKKLSNRLENCMVRLRLSYWSQPCVRKWAVTFAGYCLQFMSFYDSKVSTLCKMHPRRKKKSGRRGPAWAWFACAWCVESRSVFGFGPGLVGVELYCCWVLRFNFFNFYAGPCVIPFFPIIGQNSRLSEHWGKREKSHGYTKGMVLLRFEF